MIMTVFIVIVITGLCLIAVEQVKENTEEFFISGNYGKRKTIFERFSELFF